MVDEPTKNSMAVLIGGEPEHYGVLNETVVNLWSRLTQHEDLVWDDLSDEEKNRLLRLNGCLNKLSACLLQCSRLSYHYEWLLGNARDNSVNKFPSGVDEAHLAYAGIAACSDFESLLLQGCAALDRLAHFVSSEFKSPTNRYRRLVNVLRNFTQADSRASELLSVQKTSKRWIDGVLTVIDSTGSLRDLVAHNESVSERMNSCFAITLLENRKALVYDCEVGGLGVFETTCSAAVHLPYVILNSLAIVFGKTPLKDIASFSIPWKNETVLLRNFATDEPDDSPLGPHVARVAKRMIPSGVQLMTRNVDSSLFDHIVNLPAKQDGTDPP